MEQRRPIILFLILTSTVLEFSIIHAQQSSEIEKNVVRVKTLLEDKAPIQGFGFIFYEEEDLIYFITARHNVVLSTKDVVGIEVNFWGENKCYMASLIKPDPELDLALLMVKKPKGFYWDYRNITDNAIVGQKARIIGRDGKWDIISSAQAGEISQISSTEIIVKDFYQAKVGSSGGPLLNQKGIVGMVTHDEGSRIFAIPIKIISERVLDLLNIQDKNYQDLPVIYLGVSGSGHLNLAWVEDLYRNPRGMSAGLFIEAAFSRKLGFQFEGSYNWLTSGSEQEYEADYHFKNTFYSFSGSILFYPISNQYRFMPKINFGYSYTKIKPQLSLDKNTWIDLQDFGGFDFNFSDTAHSLKIGVGFNYLIYSDYLLGFDFGFEYFLNKYLYLDVLNPLEKNQKNDWLIYLKLRIGLIFGSKRSKIKLLR